MQALKSWSDSDGRQDWLRKMRTLIDMADLRASEEDDYVENMRSKLGGADFSDAMGDE